MIFLILDIIKKFCNIHVRVAITILGFLLIGSLLLLVPYTNTNLFSNAMTVIIDPAINDTSQSNEGYSNNLEKAKNNYQLQLPTTANNRINEKKISNYNNFENKITEYVPNYNILENQDLLKVFCRFSIL